MSIGLGCTVSGSPTGCRVPCIVQLWHPASASSRSRCSPVVVCTTVAPDVLCGLVDIAEPSGILVTTLVGGGTQDGVLCLLWVVGVWVASWISVAVVGGHDLSLCCTCDD